MNSNAALKMVEHPQRRVRDSKLVKWTAIGALGVAAVASMSLFVGSARLGQLSMRARESAALTKVMTESICRTNEGNVRMKTASGETMDVQSGLISNGVNSKAKETINVEGQSVWIALSVDTAVSGNKLATFGSGESTATKKIGPCTQ